MMDSHMEQFKEKMIHNSFIAEQRAMEVRQDFTGGMMLPDTDRADEFEAKVREEVRKIEDTANVVTAVDVEAERVHVAFLLGESVDEDLVRDLIERMNHRIYQHSTGGA